MANIKIIAYLKPVCGWSNGVRAVLQKYKLPYEDRDIINNQTDFNEMVGKPASASHPAWRSMGRCSRMSAGMRWRPTWSRQG